MIITRLYQAVDLVLGEEIVLDLDASHRLLHVLRGKKGDQLQLFNGQANQGVWGDFVGEITQLSKKKVGVRLHDFVPRDVESPLAIHLAQAIPKGEKMDFIVQKAVELGVKKITPLITARCNVRLNQERMQHRMAHWQSVLIHACEQSGRNVVPALSMPQPLLRWVGSELPKQRYVLNPQAAEKQVLPEMSIRRDTQVVVLIGPEGGLTSLEVDLAIQQGFISLTLGPRILRAETASLAALAIFQYIQGDMRAC